MSNIADDIVAQPTIGRSNISRRVWRRIAGVLFLGLAGVVVFNVALSVFRADERVRAGGQLSQYRATLEAALQRLTWLPAMLADDRGPQRVLDGASADTLNDAFADVAARAAIEAVYLMDRDGLTIAASNHDEPNGFLGENYRFRPYFREAMAGSTGTFFGVGATTRRPGYFVAAPVFGTSDTPLGVLTVKLSLSDLEDNWAKSGDPVFVTDTSGIVLLASDPTWRYRTLRTLEPELLTEIRARRQFAGADLTPFAHIGADGDALPRPAGSILHLRSPVAEADWTLHYLADDRAAWTRAWLAVAVMLVLTTLVMLGAQTLRADRVRAALGLSRAESRALKKANDRLAIEIAERRATQDRLADTRIELRRSSRLAALGQLSASVSHELSQPIAAMRNHLAAATLTLPDDASDRTRLSRFDSLVDRMEAITRQLKFFGKPGDGMMADVDVASAIDAALALLQPNVERTDVAVHISAPDAPLLIRGNRLRIEQVLVNLIRNGIDAVEDAGPATNVHAIAIETRVAAELARITVSDTGDGFGSRHLDDLAEPFATTKASGEGMGLGLAISREIAREHGGELAAWNNVSGPGATFELSLPLSRPAK